MADPRDIVDIPGVEAPAHSLRGDHGANGPQGRPWLSVWFRCCHTYGRMYRNASRTAYEGACPRCGGHVRAMIGRQGTSRRMFEAG